MVFGRVPATSDGGGSLQHPAPFGAAYDEERELDHIQGTVGV
jgi:hypothetical protein